MRIGVRGFSLRVFQVGSDVSKEEKRRQSAEELRRARERADRVLDRTVIIPVRRVYDHVAVGVHRGLTKMFAGKAREEATILEQNKVAAFMQKNRPHVARSLWNIFSAIARDTSVEGVRSAASVLGRILRSSTPLDDIALIDQIVTKRHTELNNLRQRSADSVSKSITDSARKKIMAVPEKGTRVSDLISDVDALMDRKWALVETVVRTDTSYAYNQAQVDGLAAIGAEDEFRGVRGRWTELIDDLTGVPFDDRVAADSKAMHGQVALPNGVFTMPANAANVQHALLGKSWKHPPNRPNDRAVLTPWMPSWGIPGWSLRGGRRIPL